eukprot:8212346-Pyramimonas_sp.AAC.1
MSEAADAAIRVAAALVEGHDPPDEGQVGDRGRSGWRLASPPSGSIGRCNCTTNSAMEPRGSAPRVAGGHSLKLRAACKGMRPRRQRAPTRSCRFPAQLAGSILGLGPLASEFPRREVSAVGLPTRWRRSC